MNSEKVVSPIDSIKKFFSKYITKFDIIVFFCTFAFSLVVHLYMFTNLMLNHDNIDGLFSDCSFGLSSGRWMLHFLTVITGDFASSWFDGVLGAIFLSMGATLIVRFFRIKRYLPALIATFMLVAFPTVASTYAYMFNATQYLFSLFLSVVAAVLIRKEKFWSMALGTAVLTIAVGCYQSYFCLTALLLVIAVMTDILSGRFEKAKGIILTALKYICCLAIAMVLYFVVLKLLLFITGTQLVSYSGMDAMGVLSFGEFGKRIVDAYLYFGAYYIDYKQIYTDIFPVLAIASFIITLGVIVYCIIKNKIHKKPVSMILIIAIIVIFPFATFMAYLMADRWSVHQVMFYPAVIPLMLPCLYLDRIKFCGKKIKDKLITAVSVILIALTTVTAYEFAFVTNRAYFYMGMTYENVYAFYTKLAAKVELTEGYTKDTPVALIGGAAAGSVVPPTNMTGIFTGDDALNFYSRTIFLHYYLATEYVYPSDADVEIIKTTADYAQMPAYPAEGSIKKINGIIAVKLS